MTGRELFEIWAPEGSVWSRWAKPVLFADLGAVPDAVAGALPAAGLPDGLPRDETAAAALGRIDPGTAVIVDLPGPEAVATGLALARQGFRPVPLFNTAYHPLALVEVGTILRLLVAGAEELGGLYLSPEAPPAFLLDASRLKPTTPPSPGRFDNRWMVFPQDLPSASFLLSQNLHRVTVLQRLPDDQPGEDLAHALLRWQEAGIEIYGYDPRAGGAPRRLEVRKPSRFRQLSYRASAILGLRRNSAGGFGTVLPNPGTGGGGGFG
jgi:hypothetical protein